MIAPPRPPSQDEPEALIKEARARQLRRRILGAAGVAIAAGLALGIYALAGGFGHASPAGSGQRPAAAPPCRSSQLTALMQWPYGETPDGWVLLTNTSRSSCSLPAGVPRAWITWGGKRLATHEVLRLGLHPSQWTPLRTAPVLRQGQQAFVTFAWLNWCNNPYRRLQTGHLRFGKAVVSFDVGAHPAYQTCGSPSIVQVSRPLLVRGQG